MKMNLEEYGRKQYYSSIYLEELGNITTDLGQDNGLMSQESNRELPNMKHGS